MDAFRIRAARRHLWRAWLFGGLAWSVVFVGLAAAVTWLVGAPGARTVQLALTLAIVVCGGLYAVVRLAAATWAVARWAAGRQSERRPADYAHMHSLEALLSKFARRTNARSWTGTRPEVREGRLLLAILGQVGLPTSAGDVSASDALVRLSRAEAAHVLAVAGTTSLAYGRASPRSGAVEEAGQALASFKENAMFFGNGRWEDAPSAGWMPLTTATFECGVLGYDDAYAFVFWVEEED